MDILELIKEMQEAKRKQRISPDHVLLPELINTIRQEAEQKINELYKSGKIGLTSTVNAKAVYIKE